MLGLQLLVQDTSVIFQLNLLDQLTCVLYQQISNYLVTENKKSSYIKLCTHYYDNLALLLRFKTN